MSRADETVHPYEVVKHYYGGGMEESAVPGLTIREHFAGLAITSVTAEVNQDALAIKDVAAELGIKADEYKSAIHWDQFVALRIRKRADALIAELAK